MVSVTSRSTAGTFLMECKNTVTRPITRHARRTAHQHMSATGPSDTTNSRRGSRAGALDETEPQENTSGLDGCHSTRVAVAGGPTQTTTYSPPPAAPPPPASQPPAGHPHNQRPIKQLPVRVALLPFRLAHRAFGIACRVALGPVRAALGQQIPLSNRRHLVLLPERLEHLLGAHAFFQVSF